MQIANDHTPPVRELTAVERAMRTVGWATDRLMERGRLKPADREARAQYYEARAETCVELSAINRRMLEFAGLNSLAASILRAPE